jgi:hypothetical protein
LANILGDAKQCTQVVAAFCSLLADLLHELAAVMNIQRRQWIDDVTNAKRRLGVDGDVHDEACNDGHGLNCLAIAMRADERLEE